MFISLKCATYGFNGAWLVATALCDSHLLYRLIGVNVRILCVNVMLLCWLFWQTFPDMIGYKIGKVCQTGNSSISKSSLNIFMQVLWHL